MLEGLAAWVLKAYIGKYVKVNADKLSVGLLSGLVELENVPLKTDAFNDNELPFDLKFGYIGKIKVNISLNSLRYSPWSITAENIFVIIGPKHSNKTSNLDKFDSSSSSNGGVPFTSSSPSKTSEEHLSTHRNSNDENSTSNKFVNDNLTNLNEIDFFQLNNEKSNKEKLEKLINLENKWFKEVEFLGGSSNEEQSKLFSIFGPMAYSLLKNLHVNLNNIHLRYEDELNNFSIGTNIDSISILNETDFTSQDKENFSFESNEPSTNSSSSTNNIKYSKNLSFKFCQVKNLSVYTDSKILFDSSLKVETLFEQMKFDNISSTSKRETQSKNSNDDSLNLDDVKISSSFNYLIKPSSLKAQIIRDVSSHPLRKRNKPRIRITSILKELRLNVNDKQIEYLSLVIKSINIYNNRLLCDCVHCPDSLSNFIKSDPVIFTNSSNHSFQTQLENRKRLIKLRWLYIFNCIRFQIKKPKMKDFVQWSIDVNLYKKIYHQILKKRFLSSNNTALNNSQQKLNSVSTSSTSSSLVAVNGTQVASIGTIEQNNSSLSTTNSEYVATNYESNLYNLPQDLFKEKQRIEHEWDFNRLVLIRRVIFEKFVKSNDFKEYLTKIKNSNATGKSSNSQKASPYNYLGVYSYMSWRLTNLKDYYFTKSPNDLKDQTPTNTNDSESSQHEESQTVHNKIDDEVIALINDSIENDSLFRRDTLLAILEFKLESASIILSSSKNKILNKSDAFKYNNLSDIVELKLEKSTLLFEALPRHDSYLFQINLSSFYLYDCNSFTNDNKKLNKKNNFPVLVYPKSYTKMKQNSSFYKIEKVNSAVGFANELNDDDLNNSIDPSYKYFNVNNEFVFQLIYEHNPYEINLNNFKRNSANLRIKSCGLDVIYNLQLVKQLKDFFETVNQLYNDAQSVIIKVPKNESSKLKPKLNKKNYLNENSEDEINESTMSTYIYSFYPHLPTKDINFDFEITAPKVIFPQDFYSNNPLVVIFDFGRLAFQNRNKIELEKPKNDELFINGDKSTMRKSRTEASLKPFKELHKVSQENIRTLDTKNNESHVLFDLNRCSSESRIISENETTKEKAVERSNIWNEIDSDDDEDLFETPLSTPPNELNESSSTTKILTLSKALGSDLNASISSDIITSISSDMNALDAKNINKKNQQNSLNNLSVNFYSTYDLCLNDLQTIIGRYNTDNLQAHLKKGHSKFHLLEKFDIHIQIDVLKLKPTQLQLKSKFDSFYKIFLDQTNRRQQNDNKNDNHLNYKEEDDDDEDLFTPLKINVILNLLKLHIDDIKLVCIHKTIENIRKLFIDSNNKTFAAGASFYEQNKSNTKISNEFSQTPLVDDKLLDNSFCSHHTSTRIPPATTPTPIRQINETDESIKMNSYEEFKFKYKLTSLIFKINEIDVTMSVTATSDESYRHNFSMLTSINELKSICEMKLYGINSQYIFYQNGNQLIRFEILGLLMIDARQIFGTDYQLLAASHRQIELDSQTGSIKDRFTSNVSDFNSRFNSKINNIETTGLKPIINIDFHINNTILPCCNVSHKEYVIDSSFSTLDIILNPETISEMIMLFYGSFISISSNQINEQRNEAAFYNESIEQKLNESFNEPIEQIQSKLNSINYGLDLNNQSENNENSSSKLNLSKASNENSFGHRLSISFRFARLSVLMFKIESFEKARKVALFVLNGASVDACLISERKFLQVISKIKGLKVVDLKEAAKEKSKYKSIFGIGLQNEREFITPLQNSENQLESSDSQVFEIIYKKSEQKDKNLNEKQQETSELKIQMASLCYLHSPEFIHDIQSCLKDFMKFHVKTIEDLTEKATNLALDMFKKGTSYLQNTIADIYQGTAVSTVKDCQTKVDNSKAKPVTIKIKILLQTPVIALPMSQDSNLLVIGHLGHITISNAASEDKSQLFENKNNSNPKFENLKSNDQLNFDKFVSDSTKFSINLKNVSLFTINLGKEKEFFKNSKIKKKSNFIISTTAAELAAETAATNLGTESNNSSWFDDFFIENNFQIYYEPKFSDKLIDETDIGMSLDYLPKFGDDSNSNETNLADLKDVETKPASNINGGNIRVKLNIGACQISLSKTQLEQLLKTLDNIVYDDRIKSSTEIVEFTSGTENQETIASLEHDKENMPIKQNAPTELKQAEIDINSPSSTFVSSSFSTCLNSTYPKYVETDDELKSDLSLYVRFKIDVLKINFLADVEKPNQEIAELCFNDYELLISRYEKYVKHFNMTLESLYLFDKLKIGNKNPSNLNDLKKSADVSIEDETNENDNILLLKSFPRSKTIKHICSKRPKDFSYLSYSMPNLSSNHNYYFTDSFPKSSSQNKIRKNKKLNFVELAKFYEKLNCNLSTSLPSEIPFYSNKLKDYKPEVKHFDDENVYSKDKSELFSNYPSTPPPSPSSKKKTFFGSRSESMSNINEQDSSISLSSSCLSNKKKIKTNETTDESQQLQSDGFESKEKCLACLNQRNPLVSIDIMFIDKIHPKITNVFNDINRFIKINFSELELNLNPETWIILLDMLGLGSKIYSQENNQNENSNPDFLSFISKPNISRIDSILNDNDENADGFQNSSIDFKVNHFSIRLNKSTSSSQFAKINIDNFLLLIETKQDFLKTYGKLGSFELYDISAYKGLYTDRFLTSGNQALEFEFFKFSGPPDIFCTREFDMELKLRMSSVKYVHTNRFINEITHYFNQFNQLQDALGRMRAISIGLKNISCMPQRGSRIKLDIQAQTPIVAIPVNSYSIDALVINLGNIQIENKFLRSGEHGTLVNGKLIHDDENSFMENSKDSLNKSNAAFDTSQCLLDLMKIQLTDTNVYSAIRSANKSSSETNQHKNMRRNSRNEKDSFKDNEKRQFYDNLAEGVDYQNTKKRHSQWKNQPHQQQPTISNKQNIYKVEFKNFVFKQHSNNILEEKSYLFIQLERNLESELSHKSPDWSIYARLTSFLFSIDLRQYKLIRGILDHNIGEQINEYSQPNFLMPNSTIETVLTGEVWKVISINLDLENVGIELLNNHAIPVYSESFYNLPTNGIASPLMKSSLAYLAFIKSCLIFESYSDGSKLTDLVSNEIQVNDTRSGQLTKNEPNETKNQQQQQQQDETIKDKPNIFFNILSNPESLNKNEENLSKNLQLEVHYRSNKNSNRYSILINNCRVIAVVDWLIKVKNFLMSNFEFDDSAAASISNQRGQVASNPSSQQIQNLENNTTATSTSTTTATTSQINSNMKNGPPQPIEVKVNLKNTDFVLVENTNDLNSQAVILRLTSFIEFNEKKLTRPLECSLQSLELFSCQMNAIEETALSIIDPVKFNINVNLKGFFNSDENELIYMNSKLDNEEELILNETKNASLTNSTSGCLNGQKALLQFITNVSSDSLKLRFSYLDFKLFLKLIESIKKQFDHSELENSSSPLSGTRSTNPSQNEYYGGSATNDKNYSNHEKLKKDVSSNFRQNSSNPNESGVAGGGLGIGVSDGVQWLIYCINLNIRNFCICIIDDCKNVDVPLTDIQFNRLKVVHYFSNENELKQRANVSSITNQNSPSSIEQGSAEFGLNIDYYNRLLSGWEPLIEPWLARLDWKFKPNSNCFTLTSMDVLNFNVTNPFIDLISGVLLNWKDEYEQKSMNQSKRHQLFQPYKIINLTGQKFQFCTFQDTNSSSFNLIDGSKVSQDSKYEKYDLTDFSSIPDLDSISSKWIDIEDKSEKLFNFYQHKNFVEANSSTTKSVTMHSNHHYAQRAHNYQLRELVQHRIRIKLDDWTEIRPLTVDKVGTYFRDINRSNRLPKIASATRLIFDISLSGNATKIIEVKSPVSIKNHLKYKLQCRIEPFYQQTMTRLGPLIIEIDTDSEISVPIKYLPCNIWFRPLELEMNKEAEFSNMLINCNDVNQPGQVEYYQLGCKLSNSNENFMKPVSHTLNSIIGSEIFYFFAKIKRHNFSSRIIKNPNDFKKSNQSNQSSRQSLKSSNLNSISGHLISIEPAFTLYNLLPVEFRYKFITTIEANPNNNNNSSSGNTLRSNSAFKQKKFENLTNGKIDSYKCNYFSNINVKNPVDLLLDIDNFRMVKAIEINPSKHLINQYKMNDQYSTQDSAVSSSSSSPQSSLANDQNDSTTQKLLNSSNSLNAPNSMSPLSNKKLTILRRVNFFDEKNRPLFLIARIIFKIGSGLIVKNKEALIKSQQQFVQSYSNKTKSNSNNTAIGGSGGGSSDFFNSCPIVVHISAVYCFFNLTGLPLVFRQHNCEEASGQQEEHEMARSNQPLLFSFNEVDSPYACSMRVGKLCNDFKTHQQEKSNRLSNQTNKFETNGANSKRNKIIPKWSKPFGLEGGSSYRALHVINNTIYNSNAELKDSDANLSNSSSLNHSTVGYSYSSEQQHLTTSNNTETISSSNVSYLQPDWVYYIGIEIKQGKGLLKDTVFVYFTTRYYLVNRSSKNLLIAQYFAIQNLKEQNNSLLWRSRNFDKSSSLLFNNNSNNDKLADDLISNDNSADSLPPSSAENNQEIAHSIILLSNSMTQFHWPRTDRDQLLSIRLKSDFNYNWSGGFRIDNVDSFHLNLRHKFRSNDFFFLKVEVILDGGTFFIVFSDIIDFPPSIAIQNLAEVPIYFYQAQTPEDKYILTLKSNKTLNYSWDEPILEKKLIIGVKGGTSELLDFSLLDDRKYLFYENYIYILFENSSNLNQTNKSMYYNINSNLSNSEFVLTAANNKVYIDYKESGNRDQLWHMTVDGLLVHEGSSPPKEFGHNSIQDLSNRYVLDIDDVAPRPNRFIPLALRKSDPRRNNTQKWTFHKDGFLCCRVINMCLQVEENFKRHSRVVLGPMKASSISNNSDFSLMKVSRQRLRPGSGHLCVEMFTDGPTRVLKIYNLNEQTYSSINWKKASNEQDKSGILKGSDGANSENEDGKSMVASKNKSIETYINLTGGIGISLIHWSNQEYEELVYAYLKSFEVNFDQNSLEQRFMVNVESIQVCNQLFNSCRQNLIYINNSQNTSEDSTLKTGQTIKKPQPALSIDFLRLFKYENLITIKHLLVNLSDLNLQVEEKLLWKIIQMMGFDKIDTSSEIHLSKKYLHKLNKNKSQDDSILNRNNHHQVNKKDTKKSETVDSDSLSINYYKTRINSLVANSQAIKYSFNKFQINKIHMSLSVYKTSKLSTDLLKVKSSLGIPLIQFENARIELKSFILMNEHDTASCILNLIKKHYTQELRSNAIRILGSVDFLGNPLGFVADFKESLSNVLSNGQVTDFVFSITHGFANSVSKFSGFLSDELNELTLDERHRETREQIRNIYSNGSIDHFVGGALGFAVGIVGGALSLATQTYRGFNENGLTGAFAGIGKGAVGTLSKPIVGMLDFTTGIASAIRETSKTSYKMEIPRIRETRCCTTPGALLTPFSRSDADGQKILYQVNSFNLNEKYISLEQISTLSETIIVIISNQRAIFLKSSEYEYRTLYEITYQELKSISVLEDNNKIYLEAFLEEADGKKLQSQKFKFENKQIASSLANKIRFGKADFDEIFYSLANYEDDTDDE